MLVEKKLGDALKAHEKGRKVVVLQELEDGSMWTTTMEDFLDDSIHYLVDVPYNENPEFKQAVDDMISGIQKATLVPAEEDKPQEQPDSGGITENVPETDKSKYEIVEELTLQGMSCKEIVRLTGFKNSLVSQYRYKMKQKSEQNVFPPGHNADRKKCTTCQYRSSGYTKNGCDYIEHTGHRRGCSVEDCDKYVKGERLSRKDDPITEEE